MATCKNCRKPHKTGGNFCSRKCRLEKMSIDKKRYKEQMKHVDKNDPLLSFGITGRGAFDHEGNKI